MGLPSISELSALWEKYKDMLKPQFLYTVKTPTGNIVEALTPVAKELRDNHECELVNKRLVLEVAWEGNKYYIDSYAISRTVEDALQGKKS